MSDPVKVLVLYDHPLLGEGLGALMASVPSSTVERVAMGDPDAMERAITADADVVILEEGGPVGLVDLLRDSRCRAIVDVSISTSQAWTIRREEISPDPESLIDRIVDACLGDRRSAAALAAPAHRLTRPGPTAGRRSHPASPPPRPPGRRRRGRGSPAKAARSARARLAAARRGTMPRMDDPAAPRSPSRRPSVAAGRSPSSARPSPGWSSWTPAARRHARAARLGAGRRGPRDAARWTSRCPSASPERWAGASVAGSAWLVLRAAGELVAFDPRCTHARCAYEWTDQANFACLCHEGFFDLDGTVISGPPPRPLDRFGVRGDGGSIELEVPADFATPRPRPDGSPGAGCPKCPGASAHHHPADTGPRHAVTTHLACIHLLPPGG